MFCEPFRLKPKPARVTSIAWVAIALFDFSSCHSRAAGLSGAFVPLAPGTVINLTSNGLIDWAHWGLNASNRFNHKAGAGLLSDLAVIGSSPVVAFSTNVVVYSWS